MSAEQIDLDAIRARAEAATPGPWVKRDEVDGVYAGRSTVVRAADGPRVVSVGQTRRHDNARAEVNVAHIAGMDPQTTLALVAEVERLRDEVERLRDPLRPADDAESSGAAWSTGWRSFDSMSRKSAIATCGALVDMRDRAIRRYEGAEAERDAANAKVSEVVAAVEVLADELMRAGQQDDGNDDFMRGWVTATAEASTDLRAALTPYRDNKEKP